MGLAICNYLSSISGTETFSIAQMTVVGTRAGWHLAHSFSKGSTSSYPCFPPRYEKASTTGNPAFIALVLSASLKLTNSLRQKATPNVGFLTPPNDMSFFFPLSWRKKFLVFIPEVCFSSPLYLSYSHKHFYKTSIVVASSGRQTHALLYTVQFFGTHSQSNTLFYVSFLPSVYLSVITYHILF